jgi:DNA-binding response OmpR family regulator
MNAAFFVADVSSAEHLRVLVADDQPATLAPRAHLLEADRLHPDVIVLDVSMPRLNGVKAAPGALM